MDLSRGAGVRIPDLICTFAYSLLYMNDREVDALSAPYWLEVVHPIVVCKEVLET